MSDVPVTKYRSVSEMPRPERVSDDQLLERIRAVWNRALLLHPRTIRPGVRRYRSLEEANADQQRDLARR